MTTSLKSQLATLTTLTTKNCQERGESLVTQSEASSRLLVLWLQHFREARLTGTADSLVDGAMSAVREAAACVALGLVRPAITSLRLQVDLGLGWLYFKDHPVEWRRVQSTGEGFMLRSDVLKYFDEHYPQFRNRFGILVQQMTRSQKDPYRLLSAHIHAQSESTIPKVEDPCDIVATEQLQDDLVKLQAECSEYLNDLFWCIFADRWAIVGDDLKMTLEARFKTSAQRAEFFKS